MNCFLYAKLIRDLITCGVGGFIAYLIVRFRWWIIMGVLTPFFFVFGWLWGVPIIKARDCASIDPGYIVTPWDLDVRPWKFRQRCFEIPRWVIWVLASPPIAIALTLVGVLLWTFGEFLYHRYWIC